MEGPVSVHTPGVSRRRSTAFFLLPLLLLFSSLFAAACATANLAESLRGEVVDSRSATGYGGQLHYFLTVECREAKGALSRVTLEVKQEDWMRFHSTGEEVCLVPQFGDLRLSRCR
jgi:hypothetical protein